MKIGFRTLILAAGAFALSSMASGTALAQGKVFNWANDGDVNSMDPYARNETFLLSFNANIYEPLVRRDRDLKLEPALATRWEQTSPTTWRFQLRQDVKFHDGTPFTADDVVFSHRARARPGVEHAGRHFASVKEVRKVDDQTVELETQVARTRILLEKIASSASCPRPGRRRTTPPASPT